MPRHEVTAEKYERLKAALIEHGGNCQKASSIIQISWNTAKHAWDKGWPKRGFRAVKEIVQEEQDRVRAERDRRDAEEKERLSRDSFEQQTQEAQICKLARQTAVSLQAEAAMLSIAGRSIAQHLQAQVNQLLAGGQMSVSDCVQTMNRIGRFSRDVNTLSQTAMEMERQRVGEPTHIIGVQIEPASMEEAARDIEHASDLLELVRSRKPQIATTDEPDSGNGAVH